jgi:hypothetical protein
MSNSLMNKYAFQTKEFRLTDDGIHFLRSGFSYKTIRFKEIDRADIKKGKELNNWIFIFIMGIMLIIPGIWLALNLITAFLADDLNISHATMVISFLIPLVGGYFIFSSLQTGTILQIYYGDDKSYKFSLREIVSDNRIKEFTITIKHKLGTKLREE